MRCYMEYCLQMEKYSKHLEQLVGERTEELEEEKERAMSLLYSRLASGSILLCAYLLCP